MSKKAIVAFIGPWAIVMHIGLTHTRSWSQTILFEQHWLLAILFSFLVFLMISVASFILFSGLPRSWPWGRGLSIVGVSVVSAVLITVSAALDSPGHAANVNSGALGVVSFEVAFLSFFVILMKAIIVQDRLSGLPDRNLKSWWHRLTAAFHEGARQVE